MYAGAAVGVAAVGEAYGSLNGAHIRGTDVPVEEPFTASTTEAGECHNSFDQRCEMPTSIPHPLLAFHAMIDLTP